MTFRTSAPLVIELPGDEYDIYSSPDLALLLRAAEDASNVVLDFHAVQYMDSTAISVLVRLHKERLAKEFPPMHLARLARQITHLFELTKLASIWPTYVSVENALAAFCDEAKP